MANPSESVYANNHAPSVLDRHRWRRLSNSAAFLLPYLRPGMHILDIGCGPGSLTCDIAAKVGPSGKVIGIENVSAPLKDARALAEQEGVSGVCTFEVADALALPYAEGTFDVVFSHQVLQHVGDPVGMLREMRRVAKTGTGLVACRESAVPHWYPESKGLSKSLDVFMRMARDRGGNPHPGNHIHVWAREAGFERDQIKCTTGSWCFSDKAERAFWGGSFAKRSGHSEKALEGGYATEQEMEEMEKAWQDFVENDDAWYGMLHGEIVCTK